MLQNLHNSYSDSSSTTSSSSEEEDYINMEVDDHHHSSIFNQSSSCHEFEFQQSFSSSSDRDPHASTTSPADELFYMGKLLPLHLPPRLEMVNKILLHTSAASFETTPKGGDDDDGFEDEAFATPLFGATPTATTPFESCNVSPSGSCEVSRELTPHEYGFDEKRSWTRKTKMIKQSSSSSSSKIKWTSFIKSLFTKSSGCTNEHSAAADHTHFSKSKQSFNSHCKNNSAPFGQIKYNKHSNLVEDQRGRHRKSFSGAIKRLSKPKSSTTSSSSSTSTSTAPASINLLVLKRSISSSPEIESPIQAAIAHCKRSQNSRQIADEARFCSISASSRGVL